MVSAHSSKTLTKTIPYQAPSSSITTLRTLGDTSTISSVSECYNKKPQVGRFSSFKNKVSTELVSSETCLLDMLMATFLHVGVVAGYC